MGKLFDKLKEYAGGDFYPFHMPGHKRNVEDELVDEAFKEIYRTDITEIDGFDSLHNAQGILKEAQEEAAKVWHSDICRFLINGSTAGILSAISSSLHRSGILIAARNCHRSVFHGAYLRQGRLVFVQPDILYPYSFSGPISPLAIERALANCSGASAVVITSPTYEGIVSDISSIAEICHNRNKILIVDEAHGAHFGFNKELPPSAISKGADIVIQSLHKTLPAMTQTALLHICSDRVPVERVDKYLAMFQSSSPSYVLMSSIQSCVEKMSRHADGKLGKMVKNRKEFQSRVADLKVLDVPDPWAMKEDYGIPLPDPGKIVINLGDIPMSGNDLAKRLRKDYKLVMEMATPDYVVGILGMMDKKEGLDRLADAILELDDKLSANVRPSDRSVTEVAKGRHDGARVIRYPDKAHSDIIHMADAMDRLEGDYSVNGEVDFKNIKYTKLSHGLVNINSIELPLYEAIGYTAAVFVTMSPPEIPILVPGEIITKEICDTIKNALNNDHIVMGVEIQKDAAIPYIRVFPAKCN